MRRVFIDTDVILDLFLRREPHHTIALHFFSRLKGRNAQGCTSPVAVANTYCMLAKIRNKRYAIQKITRLRRLLQIAAVDQSIVDAALEAPYKDFEDSIQYHCARQNGLEHLITRNLTDYPRGPLKVLLPEEYLALENTRP